MLQLLECIDQLVLHHGKFVHLQVSDTEGETDQLEVLIDLEMFMHPAVLLLYFQFSRGLWDVRSCLSHLFMRRFVTPSYRLLGFCWYDRAPFVMIHFVVALISTFNILNHSSIVLSFCTCFTIAVRL